MDLAMLPAPVNRIGFFLDDPGSRARVKGQQFSH